MRIHPGESVRARRLCQEVLLLLYSAAAISQGAYTGAAEDAGAPYCPACCLSRGPYARGELCISNRSNRDVKKTLMKP
jgi:hypothetical protein